MFQRIHWILTSPDGPTKISFIRCLMIEYENEKAKPAHYLAQIVDYNDLYGQ